MFHDVVDDPGTRSPAELRSAYEAELRAAIDAVGVETVAAETGVDAATLERVGREGVPELTLDRAAAIAALREDVRDAETVTAEIRDHLLLGMSTGVLDVDTVAANVDLDLSGKEIQQILEGRATVTLAQLAAIHRFVAARNDR